MPIFFAQLAHLCSQNVHISPKFPPFTKYPYLPKMPISAQDDQLRQLCGRSLSVRCIDPAVDDGEEQGHQEVPRRALRVWEDHHRQGWGLGDTWPTKWFQVIKASRCLDGAINPLGIYPYLTFYWGKRYLVVKESAWKDLWWSNVCFVIDGFPVTLTVHTW